MKPLALLVLVGFAAQADPLTPASWKKLNLGVGDCKVIGYELDGNCPGVKTLAEALKSTSTPFDAIVAMNLPLGKELLKNPSPAVRVRAAALLAGTDAQDAVLAVAAKEPDAGVMQAFVRMLAISGAKLPKVGAFLLKSGDHPDAKVREQVVFALGSSWNRELKGAAEKLLSMAEKDKDAAVRQAACEYGGELGNKVFLPFMEKNTAASAESGMYAACMSGLLRMFHASPRYETADEGASKLFLQRVAEKPRSAERPPWNLMNAFQHDDDERNEGLAAWRKKATWWKPDEVRKVLSDLVADKTANAMARKGAVMSLLGLGATKVELLALRAGYDEKSNDDKVVLKAIEVAVAKAK